MNFDQPPPEPLASATGFLLSWNGRRTAEGFAAALDQVGLKPPIFGMLRLVDANPGRTQRELVDGALIDPSSMVAILDDLEQHGLAERRPHRSDRRKHAVHLTRKGKRLLERAEGIANEFTEELLKPLDEGEREMLRLLLRKLARLDAEDAR